MILSKVQNASESDIINTIEAEVKRIIDESYAKAQELIKAHMDVLHSSAQLLIEKEKVTREEFEALFEGSAV